MPRPARAVSKRINRAPHGALIVQMVPIFVQPAHPSAHIGGACAQKYRITTYNAHKLSN